MARRALLSVPERLPELLAAGVSFVVAAFVVWETLRDGMPALRHDWRIPADTAALSQSLLAYTSGWIDVGIGEPQTYPTFYHVAAVLWLLHWVVPPIGVVAALVGAGAFIAAVAAFAFAYRRGAGVVASTAVAIVAACNPWVYAKIVAGHVFMVLAYAILIALVAEIDRPRPRTIALVLLGSLTIVQVQFFLIAVVPLTSWAIRERRLLVAVAPWIAFAPIAAGIVAGYASLRAVPFTLSWQDTMSVAPLDGLMLSGYVFGYGRAFTVDMPLAIVLAAIAATGIVTLRRAHERVVVVVAALAWVFATGTVGWFAPLYRAAAVRFPEIGVYRELYDLIALVAIGYVVLLANACARRPSRARAVVVALAALAIASVWAANPPAQHYASASDLPHPALPADSHRRVALMPAFQPLVFRGESSGVDPDAFVRAGQALPINEPSPHFPVDVALAYYEQQGATEPLEALATSAIVTRPYLRSDVEALRFTALPFARGTARAPAPFGAAPLVGVSDGTPPIVAIGNDVGGFGRFFGDDPGTIVPLVDRTSSTAFRTDWVDARLAFRARPAWGTSVGGVATASRTPVAIAAAGMHAVLAQTDGTIVDDRGDVVATRRPTLRWWPITSEARTLSCDAACIVVALARAPIPARDDGPHVRDTPIAFRRPVPWLALATVPPHARTQTLRYVERYDPNWIALRGITTLPHLRLVGELNGWIVDPAPEKAQTLVLLHWPSLLQFVLELVSFAFVVAAIAIVAKRDAR